MTMSPFDHQTDEVLGRMLREHLTGPAPEAFLRRMRGAMTGAERGNQWDVLSGWARPRVMAMAIAAGFLLWVGTWVAGAIFPAEPGVTIASLPAHTVVTGQAPKVDEFMMIMRERP